MTRARPFNLLRRAGILLRSLLLVLALGTVSGASGAISGGSGVTTSYGYAVFGGLKYGADFTHLDYTNPDAPKGGIFRYAGGTSYDSLNQFSVIGTFPWLMLYAYDPLMERSLDEPASYYGVIARTITYPDDLAWVEFELHPEARWHDGKPITVDDVLFTLEIYRGDLVNPRYGAAGRVVTKAYQTGANSVRMELIQKDNPVLPSVVASMKVLPRHFYDKHDLNHPMLDVPVTSGPYRIGTVEPGRIFEMVRDREYWGAELPMRRGRFNFDSIRHYFFRDFSAQLAAFDAGLVDLRFEGTARRWDAEKSMPAYAAGDILRNNVAYSNGAFYSSMTINSRKPFLSDRRVRRAIQLAYDFEFVRDIILRGRYGRTESYFANSAFEAAGMPTPGELKLLEPYRSSLPPEVFSDDLSAPVGGSRQNQRGNLKQARDLLAAAGYRIKDMKLIDPATGNPVTLDLVAASPLYEIYSGYFVKNMKRLGIEVRFRAFDTAQFRHLTGNRQFDLMINTPTFPPSDTPGVELRTVWSSQGSDIPNSLNFAGIRQPAIDHAIEAVLTATDHQTVIDGMRVIDRIARSEFYSVPFQHTYPAPVGEMPITYWNRFGRPKIDPTYNFPLMTMDHWWWDPKMEAALEHGVYK